MGYVRKRHMRRRTGQVPGFMKSNLQNGRKEPSGSGGVAENMGFSIRRMKMAESPHICCCL